MSSGGRALIQRENFRCCRRTTNKLTIKPDNHAVLATSRKLNLEAFTGAVVNFTGISIVCANDGAGIDVVGRISEAGKGEA